MLFNSFEFAIFLPVVFLLYWFIFQSELKLQNLLVLVVSYVFYGWWDWRFLFLIFFSTVVDYFIGLRLSSTEKDSHRKWLLFGSLFVNIGLLGFFKYCNFFIDSFADLIELFGLQSNRTSLNIILPVGISFYTFQTLSYTIDIYRRKLTPTKDFISFAAFVSFFPQLVAGPIERASNLLPQFFKERQFSYDLAKDGLQQILWGLAKKVIIADSCAPYVNDFFQNYETLPATHLILGSIFFAFQIYGDFSGYSDIAIGSAKLFGFRLMKNFDTPYFSRDMAEFWRRWHISLSTWFRDYLYIPLGGSRVDASWKKIRNVFAIFLVSGFWHGANWTFLFWGFLNALYFIPLLITNNNRKNLSKESGSKYLPGFKEFLQIGMTFTLTCIAWVFFRADSMSHAFQYLHNIFVNETYISVPPNKVLFVLLLIIGLVVWEWIQRFKDHGLQLKKIPVIARWSVYSVLTYSVTNGILGGSNEFIYFQF